MKTAFECFQHAARCERLSGDASNDETSQVLREAAQYWWALGEQAKKREAGKAHDAMSPPSLERPPSQGS